MTTEEKMEMIADILEMDLEEINSDTKLSDIDTWDSVAVLSFIAIMNDEFNKFPMAAEIRAYRTVGDLAEAME